MIKKIFILSLALLFVFSLALDINAYGDGYTDCERDPVYERNFTAAPTIYLNLRQRACMTDSSVLKVLPPNVNVSVIAETDGWYKVKDSEGSVGWVGASLMKKTGGDSSSGAVIKNGYDSEVTKTATPTESEKEALRERVRGYILLQVESNGEAWYVYPVDGYRYYLKDGATAYEMMRSFGLGISNKDLTNLKAGNWSLVNRLKGRIVLQVEDHGEAYYVNPKDGKTHYMRNGEEAYSIMRNLSLGITNTDLNKVVSKATVETVKTPTTGSASDGSITLTGSSFAGKVSLSWSVNGFTSEKGFKIVKSTEANPVYPGDTYHYLSDPGTRSDVWTGLTAGKTYHFRVCEYLGGSCGVYSNDLPVTVEGGTGTNNSNGSITLSGNKTSEGKVALTWALSDMTSEKGFKVVVSEDENPVYPGNNYHYLSDPDIRTDTWSGLTSGKTYYFRVCEYLGGSCGIYSNNLVINY